MEYSELTETLKNDPIWTRKLNEAAVTAGLQATDKIYLIYLNKDEVVFGVRHSREGIDLNRFRQVLGVLIIEHTGIVYGLDKIKIFTRGIDEVDYLMSHSDLSEYIQGHGGSVEVVNVSENDGLVEINLSGSCSTCSSSLITMKLGIEKFLKEFLPWVTTVKPINQPEDPDFGITGVLEGIEKELQELSPENTEGGEKK